MINENNFDLWHVNGVIQSNSLFFTLDLRLKKWVDPCSLACAITKKLALVLAIVLQRQMYNTFLYAWFF